MKKWLPLATALMLAPGYASAETSGEALSWLNRISAAAHHLNYSGTFVYQRGNESETSRIVHVQDESGERERLESLDGPQREVIRTNDQVICYLPGQNTMIIEKQRVSRAFPAWLPQPLNQLTDNYHVRKGEQQRVAGYDAQVIMLEPRDGFRYGHQLWAETQSGLLLKAVTFDDRNRVVDQHSFTQINIGGAIDKAQLKPRMPDGKTVVRENLRDGAEQPMATSPWKVQPPPGFRQTRAMMRSIPGKKGPVQHMVFSDGLAAVSVFIEPANTSGVSGFTSQGAINVYTRTLGGHLITVLGEVPMATVKQIANGAYYKAK